MPRKAKNNNVKIVDMLVQNDISDVVNIDEEWLIDPDDLNHFDLIREQDHVSVFKAYWRGYQEVCVKRIRVTSDNIRLVKREVDILSKCIHPKVCQYLGAGVKGTYAYLLFEYMSNGNLAEYIAKRPLNDQQKSGILQSILVGMSYLSSRTPHKILHRDFKPSNILVDRHGDVKICDFGVSKQLYSVDRTSCDGLQTSLSGSLLIAHSAETSDISHTGIGTPRWVAPEVVLEDSVYDERCDIYSFGLLAFFVMTNGVMPYFQEHKNNAAQITYAKSINSRPFLEHVRLASYPRMTRMIAACTERDPELRPRDAKAIIEEYFMRNNEEEDGSTKSSSLASDHVMNFSISI